MSEAPAPEIPQLAAPNAAFQRGDFRAARKQLDALFASRPSPEVEAAARALADRMAPDPWALRFGLLALIVLGIVAGLYVR